jgi:hypothetical protein
MWVFLAGLMTLGASATCSSSASGAGADEEVPVRLLSWNDEDAAALEQELSGWISEHDRKLCRPGARASDVGLTIERGELEAVITFVYETQRRTRTVPRVSEASLFRYQVAAAAEELVRSTWEAPPPARFGLLARGHFDFLGGGQWLGGGSLGAGLFVIPTLCVELTADVSGLTALPLPPGGSVSGAHFGGTVSASWLPVRLSLFRAGPRASVSAGALSVRVHEDGSTDATGVTPWLVARGGASLGVETRHVMVLALAEAGWAFTGAAVEVEGVRVQSIRGFVAQVGLQVGWLW